MTTVVLDRGAITIEDPPKGLEKELTYWKRELVVDKRTHKREMQGHYEKLFSMLGDGKMVTFPGFAHRILEFLRKTGTRFEAKDMRIPMPEPDFETACAGLRDYQLEPVITAVTSGGGILSLPTGSGKTNISAALISAFDRNKLITRGTPLIVFAAPDKDINRKNWEDLVQLFPGRNVGLVMSGARRFSDDIQVVTLDSLHLIDKEKVGVLIVDEVHTAASNERAGKLSEFRNAARWGVSATPDGRFDGSDLLTEGLFGPVVFRMTYQDIVKTGALVPIEVFWIKAPKPHIGMQYYSAYRTRDAKIKAGIVNNPEYSRLVASIMQAIPEDMSVICFTQWVRQMANIHAYCPDIAYVHAQTDEGVGTVGPIKAKERKAIYDRVKSGEIRKIFATFVWRQGVNFPGLNIVVNASAGSSDITTTQITGRASRKSDGKDRAYVIDFVHEWDVDSSSGRDRPGPLLSSDYARRRNYRELGFVQHDVESAMELPFIGGSR